LGLGRSSGGSEIGRGVGGLGESGGGVQEDVWEGLERVVGGDVSEGGVVLDCELAEGWLVSEVLFEVEQKG
jgi:hypothetical protein